MTAVAAFKPPAEGTRVALRRTLAKWRKGLFGSPLNIAITLGYALFAATVLWPFVRWAFVDAVFTGPRAACDDRTGACWIFVIEKARFLVFALYPRDLDGQAAAATALIAASLVLMAVPRLWGRKLVALVIAGFAGAIGLMGGTLTGHPVATQNWGGFPLTVLLSAAGFLGAFPLGIVLALARRSRMGLIRLLAVAFIEGFRGVPMIAVLYVSTLVFPLMVPEGASIDKLLRAQIAIILFVAAYMAEIVRSGLQSVETSQLEGGRALGLTDRQTMQLIILPQALRRVIPSFVNLAIGLFLDTTLVTVIGLFDFLNTARAAATDPNWLGFYNEAFTVAAIVYFTISAAGSRYSLWLERRLKV